MPNEFDGIAAVEAFKELAEGVGTMRAMEENVINKMQSEVVFLKSGKEVPSYANVCRGFLGQDFLHSTK